MNGAVSTKDAVSAAVGCLDVNSRPLKESDFAHVCAGVKATHKASPTAMNKSMAFGGGFKGSNRDIRAKHGIQQPSGGNH